MLTARNFSVFTHALLLVALLTAWPAIAQNLPGTGAAPPAGRAFADTLLGRQAAAALASGTIAGLYPALRAVESAEAGDPDYDYALGVAALDAGAKSEALYALQRAVTVEPDYLAARLDYARALYEVGDLETARTQFELLQTMAPPPVAATAIRNYLEGIERQMRAKGTRLSGGLEFSTGFDTNANSATDALTFAVFDVELSLDDQARETESAFAGLSGDIRYVRPASARLRWDIGGAANFREFVDAEFVSGYRYGLDTGLNYTRGKLTLGGRLSGRQQWVDGERNSDAASVSASLLAEVGPDWQLGIGARFGQVRYDNEAIARDADQSVLTLTANCRINWWGRGTLGIGLLGGADDGVSPARDATTDAVVLEAASRDVRGGGINLVLNPRPTAQVYLRANHLRADYDGPFGILGNTREDTNLSAELGARFAPRRWPGWVISSSLRFIDNDSDITVYEYDRTVAGLQFRKNFE